MEIVFKTGEVRDFFYFQKKSGNAQSTKKSRVKSGSLKLHYLVGG